MLQKLWHNVLQYELKKQIIYQDQTGFLQGRNILKNIRQVVGIIEHYNKTKQPEFIFVADFEKKPLIR